ncbi:MAG: AmmeMemoRadiSam system radical SAM enzyme [Myxococcales bacterium]|nr:AmmeMemoRadiSam system radical SAM enzyme [Myxococcales bacterium]
MEHHQAPEARYFESLPDGTVRCALCPHRCRIAPGKRGLCAVRENRAGKLYSLSYGRMVAVHDDPIEKKPLYHFLPGSRSLSLAAAGCNLSCRHCQNHAISQAPRRGRALPGDWLSPEEAVGAARSLGAASLSFTYTEPSVFFEWAHDTAKRAAAAGIRSVFVTNGYTEAKPIEDIAPVLAAANVDLKSFRDEFYRKVCGARLQPVLDTIARMRRLGIWVEVTTLLIPGENDSPEELQEAAAWLSSVDRDMPWHLSRFHPDFEMLDRPATPLSSLRRAFEIGKAAGLRFVYLGNVRGDGGEDTACPGCGETLIERRGFSVLGNKLRQGRCPGCGERIAGMWE